MSRPTDLVPGEYLDAFRVRRTVSPGARAAVIDAMGIDDDAGSTPDPVAIVPRGAPLPEPGELFLEDGTGVGRPVEMPRDAPHGYHRLRREDGTERLLITGPGRCHLPDELRAWGWAVQLAITRSGRSWGIGDLADLRDLATWSASVGAGFVAVSPLGAPNPGPRPEPSPYYPSTRRFGNPLHLSVGDVPGADATDGLERLARAGRALNGAPAVDRAAVLELKLRALRRIWAAGAERAQFDAWRARQGEALERWATFVVLTERFGADWRRWPEGYRRPGTPSVAALADENPEPPAFHAWLQWCLDRQLAVASEPLRRFADLPVGVDPGGFDAWDWQDELAEDVSIGVPPDRFNLAGQNWGMPAFSVKRLRASGHRPFIETLRAQLRHAGGLRIDHVLGLFRLWCIPRGNDPTDGAYAHLPTDELLEIVALESERAGAVVVGEDLGTVPRGVRPELRRRRILSTRLALFERVPPARYPPMVMAGVTTHDLPTVAGLWSGSDLADQRAAGVEPDAAGAERLRTRLVRAAGVEQDASLEQVRVELHRRLAASPAMLVAATLEDALGAERRPNLPGTVAPQRANWSVALPLPVEDLGGHPAVVRMTDALRR